MRWICCLVITLAATSVAAQPVSYALKGEVAVGEKPAIRITAATKVSRVRVELDRDDGKHFSLAHAALAKGQTVTLAIGDGTAGKASYKGKLSVDLAGGGAWTGDLVFDTAVRAPIKVTYDADHLDLDKHVLQFQVSRPVATAELSAIGEDGKPLGTGSATFDKQPPGTWLAVSWTQPANTRVMTLELRVSAGDGVATNVRLIPWSVTIDHEDVNFATDSSVIAPSERTKLDASLVKITDVIARSQRFMKMTLFVAGHTDTVGDRANNRKLSLDRARAIASYFRKHGVKIPIAFAGFGEDVLKVKTPDSTDEAANRRADYVIGPTGGSPPFHGPYLKARATWQQLR